MAYDRMYDLINLAINMQSNSVGVTLDDIMEDFNVSRRTAERMRNMIMAQFIQAEGYRGDDNKMYWRIPQGTLKDLIGFTAEDFACLEVAKKALENAQMEDKAKHITNIMNKISASIKTDVYKKIDNDAEVLLRAEGFAVRPGPRVVIEENIIKDLRHAVLCSYQINIEYYSKNSGKTSQYTVNPYGFIYGERNHYLLASHSNGYLDGKPHYFILSNIKSIEVTDEMFEADESFSLKEYAEQSFGAFQEEPFDVEWLFSADVADEAERMIFHPKQTTKRNGDGTLTVCFRAGGAVEMDWHLYTWGDDVTVIKPTDWYDEE